MRITRRLEFDAGHRIPHHESQCRHLHGHRYAIEVTVSGDVIVDDRDPEQGMVADFGEIKALVEESVTRVASGAALVDSAGVTMQEIVESTRSVSSIIEVITEATKQQNTGINQVSDAMASMDKATQQNASWAQTSVQASEGLKQQAVDLVAAVSLFRLQ